jgi:hypothetical protein
MVGVSPLRRRHWLVAFLLAACSDSSGTTTKPPSDGGTEEASTTPDGGTTQDQDVGPTYCSTLDPAPFLCVDFDDGAAPGDVFTKTEGAGVTVAEKGLRIESDGTTDAYVEHQTDPSPQWSVVELGFSLRIDDLATDARTTIARIGQHMTDTECRVELELTPSGITMKGGTADAKLTKTVAKGKAARIVLSQQAAADGGKVTANVTVDGQSALAAPVELACAAFPGPPRVTLGRITGAGAADLRFDDVVFDGR